MTPWQKLMWVAFAVALEIFALTGPVSAQERACTGDVEKFCKNVEGGKLKCLKEHEAELSAPCKSHVHALLARGRQIREACQGDAEKFCPHTAPGAQQFLCLRYRAPWLSAPCKAALQSSQVKQFRAPEARQSHPQLRAPEVRQSHPQHSAPEVRPSQMTMRETPTEVRIELPGDVLFDFDKWESAPMRSRRCGRWGRSSCNTREPRS
jgi:hypothetical protein